MRASFTTGVDLLNLASNGRSSKSFREEGRWDTALKARPDFIVIQFGHNDTPGKGLDRETVPGTTFRANLIRYVEESRATRAVPVLVTSIVRRNFDLAGKIKVDANLPYVEATRKVAADKNVPLIDLYALTLEQSEKLGPEQTALLDAKDAQGKPDHTHLGPKGQQEVGVIAALELIRLIPLLKIFAGTPTAWKEAAHQKDAWYGTNEAVRIANNLLIYQFPNGGWDKNMDMGVWLDAEKIKAIERQKVTGHTTIDNGATYTQMKFLARVYTATKQERFKTAFERGLQYLFEAQYPNGGWPQFYPLRKGYYTHITYNDDAMVGVMELLRNIVQKEPDYLFLNNAMRERARLAIEMSVKIILATQVKQNGKLTVWCAQHDETTLAPAKARSYELPSLSGSESVGIVKFLMGIEKPSPEIVMAVSSAIDWFKEHKITGIKLERKQQPGTAKGYDQIVVSDQNASPLWARFYELGTNRPIFCGRDGVVKYSIAEIEYERRNGYRWYVERPAKLIEEYNKWKVGH